MQKLLYRRNVAATASESAVYVGLIKARPEGIFGVKRTFSEILLYPNHLKLRLGTLPIEHTLEYELPYEKIDGLEKVSLGFGIRIRHHAKGVPKYLGISGAFGPFDSIFQDVKQAVQKHKLPVKVDY